MNTIPSTVDTSTPGLEELADRFAIFDQLWTALDKQPLGPALIYQVPKQSQVQCIALDMPELVVGRLPRAQDPSGGADLAFPEFTELSRKHFVVRREAGGQLVLEDLKSQNGTFVNTSAQRVSTKTLVAGDLIYAGGIVFAFTGD